MIRHVFLTLAFGLFLSIKAFSQVPLINSGEVISQGKELYDSGKYEASALKFLSVPKRDTNYVYMLSELALTYLADKKYDKAIEVCNEALQKPSEHTAHLLSSRAVATDKKGSFDESVGLFKEAIKKYPFDHTLIFNLGITYYNHSDYDKAEECFWKVLSFNPFHTGSHFNLARLAMGSGRRTHAAFSMGVYMSINKGDNSRLVLLNKFLGNELAGDENSVPFTGVNACEKLDQLVRSKIAMDPKFDSKIPVDAAVVKQFELIFNQLSLISSNADNDKWVRYYLPFYKALKENNMVETFIYHMVSSANNENVKKWMKKNDKKLSPFYDLANAEFNKKRKTVTAPEEFGFKEPVSAWYDRTNRLEALGVVGAGEKRQGNWYYFHNNYVKSAEGKYNTEGKKAGIWKFYNRNGEMTSIENFDSGEVTIYFPESNTKKEHFFMKNEQIEGDVEIYYSCGALKEKLNYKAGKRDGKGAAYYADGQKKEEYNYRENKLEGDYIGYHPNGKVDFKRKYVDGQVKGIAEDYYPNSKLKSSGDVVNGEKNGPWKYYYSNGRLEKTGTFKNGVGVGEWVFYEANGQISEKRTLDQSGNWAGEDINYYKGKQYNNVTYKNNVIVKIVCFDINGKQLGKYEGSNGTFANKTFYSLGQLESEGNYKKGKMDGTWTYYFPDGAKRKEYHYVDGNIQGEVIEYFPNGTKKYVSHYKDSDYDGYFQEFHENGKLKQEGWFDKGQRQQQWLTYYYDGTLESDYFYLNGQLIGQGLDYDVEGKLYFVTQYSNGLITDVEDYNSKGKKVNTFKMDGTKKVYESKYESGKTKTKYTIQCGHYTGKYTFMMPNGNEFYSYSLSEGRRTGEYKYNTSDGTLEWGGMMEDGEEEGLWKGYSSVGKLESQGRFFNGSRDSTWTYYFLSGKVSSTAYYRNGERDDASVIYSTDGTVLAEKLYEGGQLMAFRTLTNGQLGTWQLAKREMTIVANHPNGTKVYEEQFKNGLIEGAKKVYYPSGKLYSEYNFKGGDYAGPYAIYYENGNVAEKGVYENDQLIGKRQYFSEDGTLIKSEEYFKGVRHGATTRYNKGAKTSEIIFEGGTPEK